MTRAWLGFSVVWAFSLAVHAEPVEVVTVGHVTVSFEKTGDAGQIEEFKKNIVPKTSAILDSLASDLGSSPDSASAKIFFYSPQTYATKFPDTVASQIPAFFDGSAVQARADNEITVLMESTLRHELTHLLIAQNYGSKIPTWLNEGLAVYEERKNTIDSTPIFTDYNTIVVAKQQNNMMSLERLEGSGIFLRSQGTEPSKLAYRIAYVAVYELIQKSGMDSIRQYLTGLKKGRDARAEFGVVFGTPYEKYTDQLVEIAQKKS